MTKKEICLQVLRKAKREDRPATTGELMRAGAGERFGARLHELRQLGHEINSRHHREGSAYYELVHDAERGVGCMEDAELRDVRGDIPPADLAADGHLFDPVSTHVPLHPLTSRELA